MVHKVGVDWQTLKGFSKPLLLEWITPTASPSSLKCVTFFGTKSNYFRRQFGLRLRWNQISNNIDGRRV